MRIKDSRMLSLCFLTAVGVLLSSLVSCGFSEAGFVDDRYEEWKYEDYRSVLKNVDDSGMVNYARLETNRAILDRFALRMAGLPRSTFESWNSSEKISFWINAYNGLTLLAVVDHYPIEASFFASLRFPENSIRQISGVWDRLTFSIVGESLTLDTIEHEILRGDFDDPRVHFALVCAAMGCPPLRDEPYEGNSVDRQLDDQVYQFVKNPQKFRIDRQRNIVYLSKILDWYGDDFIGQFDTDSAFKGHGRKERAVLNFLSSFLPAEDDRYLRNADFQIQYLEYDWALNERISGQD